MPEVLDWRRIDDPAQAARLVAQVLRRGGVVALPTETAYVAAACAVDDVPGRFGTIAAGVRCQAVQARPSAWLA